jgi:hypothetical protein
MPRSFCSQSDGMSSPSLILPPDRVAALSLIAPLRSFRVDVGSAVLVRAGFLVSWRRSLSDVGGSQGRLLHPVAVRLSAWELACYALSTSVHR